eukprot:scaffold2033_cov367-Prasinococcus_capsulatus_cf.AAC.8
MPVHYSSPELNFHAISSPLGTQLPQAVGAAYAEKLEQLKRGLQQPERATCVYFGDGAASEGDFHGALNFAATLQAPVIFFCRNNGWAISTPTSEQYRGDGIASRAVGYGIHSIRVDGNDILAVYAATLEARRTCLENCAPVLVEAMSYRVGHHSTSDDSSRYRDMNRGYRIVDPLSRFGLWLANQGWWSNDEEEQLRKDLQADILRSIKEAEAAPKVPVRELFNDVYHDLTPHLQEQQEEILNLVKMHPDGFIKKN